MVAVRRGLNDEERWGAVLNAMNDGGEEYGYRRVMLSGLKGPAPFHIVDPEVSDCSFQSISTPSGVVAE